MWLNKKELGEKGEQLASDFLSKMDSKLLNVIIVTVMVKLILLQRIHPMVLQHSLK